MNWTVNLLSILYKNRNIYFSYFFLFLTYAIWDKILTCFVETWKATTWLKIDQKFWVHSNSVAT